MESGTYWFVISPISSVVTAIIAFTYFDGMARLLLLGSAVIGALPLLLLVGSLVIMSIFADDGEDDT